LEKLGVPLSEKSYDRVAVYLTNSLTGWEPPKGPKQHLIFKEMEEERDAAEHVKQQVKILVVLGNPPYNGFAGVAVAEERDLTNAYRTTKRAPAPQGQGLNDLYVRFYRMAERRIVEMSGRGVVCFISNYSWLDGLSFTGMRERYLDAFDRIWVDNLHGDRIISEYAPDGRTSETVFAVQGKSPGIKIGTAISLLARGPDSTKCNEGKILYRDMDQARAAERTAALVESAAQRDIDEAYKTLAPVLELGLPFKPRLVGVAYVSWPLLPELFPVSFPGIKTSRDDVVVDIDRNRLYERMELYFDPRVGHEDMRRRSPSAMISTARFNAEAVRDYLRRRGFLERNVVRYYYRPFDVRWLYWEAETKLLDEKRAEYFPHVFDGNVWIVSQQKPRRGWSRPQFIRGLGSLDLMDRGASCIPLQLRSTGPESMVLGGQEPQHARALPDGSSFNASDELSRYLSAAAHAAGVPEAFYHTLAMLHSPAYSAENAGALRQDWPRIPLPDSKDLLLASAALGRSIAALLDTETPYDAAVAALSAAQETPVGTRALQKIAVPSRTDGKPLDETKDLAVTAGWGHAGKGGVTMPGKGRLIERDCTPDERDAIPVGPGPFSRAGAPASGRPEGRPYTILGERTCDVYLNDVAYWKNIPVRVWEYAIGGYQVIKKWLSYREEKLLGRPMTKEEVRWVQEMGRRIAAILLLEPTLDENYRAVKAHTYAWSATRASSRSPAE
jgi:predicted helicase